MDSVEPRTFKERRFRKLSRAHRTWVAGVYTLLDAAGIPVYIGQSGDFRHRTAHHRAHKPWREEIANILVCHCPDPSDRLALEGQLILKYRPKYNKALMLGLNDGRVHEIRWSKYNRRKGKGQ